MKSIAQEHDCLLIDLDGTVFCGRQPTGGAVQSLSQVRSRKLFVTNNASRSADEVAAHLCELGFTATGEDVVTSAQSAAHLLAGQLAPGARVLIVGTEALANEVAAVGLRPVRRFEDRPDAVVQGLSMTTGWSDLAEAALAIRAAPCGCGQRRPHLAHRTGPAARQRVHGGCAAHGHRHGPPSGGQARARLDDRGGGPGRLPGGTGGR